MCRDPEVIGLVDVGDVWRWPPSAKDAAWVETRRGRALETAGPISA
jgi:hypothetical protein